MSRPVTLFTGQWADLPARTLAEKAAAWGYDGLELACWGDHFDVEPRARERRLRQRPARAARASTASGCWATRRHLVGQAVADRIDERHRAILPPDVWGDGDPEGVPPRAAAADEAHGAAAAALRRRRRDGLHRLADLAPRLLVAAERLRGVERGFRETAEPLAPDPRPLPGRGRPLRAGGPPDRDRVRPRHHAPALDALDGHPAFGINFDPSHFGYQYARLRPRSSPSSPTGSSTST